MDLTTGFACSAVVRAKRVVYDRRQVHKRQANGKSRTDCPHSNSLLNSQYKDRANIFLFEVICK